MPAFRETQRSTFTTTNYPTDGASVYTALVAAQRHPFESAICPAKYTTLIGAFSTAIRTTQWSSVVSTIYAAFRQTFDAAICSAHYDTIEATYISTELPANRSAIDTAHSCTKCATVWISF